MLSYLTGVASGLFLGALALLGSLYLLGFVRIPVVSATTSPRSSPQRTLLPD